MKHLFKCLLAAVSCCTVTASAITLTEAKKLYNNGDFEKALPVFRDYQKRNPRNASYNQWLGGCLYETGQSEEAVKYLEFALSKDIPDAARYLAQIALDNMDYASMEDYKRQFEELIDYDESDLSDRSREGYAKLKRTSELLNNVQHIEIFDSLTVDKKDFFKHYRISPETGTLKGIEALPFECSDSSVVVFSPESQNRVIWAAADTTGRYRLFESFKLGDGKWDKPIKLSAELNCNGDANYPFVMADGTTMFYASNGDESIGGYDIFRTKKDFTTGEFTQPQNIGMPYNSPFDDYLLVIDELNGIGWWATDRNLLEDQVTIYIFKYNEIRNNYSATREDIAQLAAIASIKDTWEEKNDYEDLRETIANISLENEKPEYDFTFHLKNGVTYHMYDDFTSTEARSLMQRYLQQQETIATKAEQLTLLRGKYYKANASEKKRLAPEILQLENQMRTAEEDILKTANSIRSAELPTMK